MTAMADELVTKRAADWGRELLDAERRVREQIARRIEREMQTPAADCGCPEQHKRNCGWRAGMGFAADVARDENYDVDPSP